MKVTKIAAAIQNGFYVPKNLLSIDSNAKTVKGQVMGFMTGILYLAPASLSGRNVCSMAVIADCITGCLNLSGRGAFTKVQIARINKTNFFFEDRELFMARLVKDIYFLIRKAKIAGLTPLVRLNGTSDIRFESIALTVDGIEYKNIFAVFPDIQFYDYTKDVNRDVSEIKNYDVTFSYSGVLAYQKYVNLALKKGMRIAVVFRSIDVIPAKFLGRDVVSGDNSDIRHLDPVNSIVALYAKGPAKKDQTGFVVDVFRTISLKVA